LDFLRSHQSYAWNFPQQLPGPSHAASAGDDPQQAVSPAPGNLGVDVPDRDEWAESNFSRLSLPQF